jgi:transcriptional regulator with XRE-family HTH domain
MDWVSIGGRIRKQREYLGLTREQLAEKLDITPKFCSDIELGVKGMSVPTLCRIATTLSLSTDYILFGKQEKKEKLSVFKALSPMVESVAPSQLPYLESVLKAVISAMNHKDDK